MGVFTPFGYRVNAAIWVVGGDDKVRVVPSIGPVRVGVTGGSTIFSVFVTCYGN